MAIASLVFAILGILAIFFSYATTAYLISHHAVWVLLIPLLPSILAVICGHIGKHRARKVHGLGESYDLAVIGLIIGYFFGGIYLTFLLTVLAFVF